MNRASAPRNFAVAKLLREDAQFMQPAKHGDLIKARISIEAAPPIFFEIRKNGEVAPRARLASRKNGGT